MIFEVMSRREALAFARDPDILSCVIISIGEPEAADVRFADNPQLRAVLSLHFIDSAEERPDAMQPSDARLILRFVERWFDEVEQIVVHCEEGVSRSAGLCAALMRRYGEDENEILRDRRYRPNERCYRLVMAARG